MSKISIPEMDAMGITSSEFLNMLNGMSELYLGKIYERYPSTAIDDITGYVRCICAKIVKMSRTLEVVAKQEHDYVVSNCIIRCIADSIASLYFIYNRDIEEIKLRHFLFVMDGIDARLKMKLKKPLVKDEYISQIEFDSLKKQYESSIKNETDCLDFCAKAIRKLPYYAEHVEQIEVLLEMRNWKFEEIDKPNKSIKWEQMYGVLMHESYDIFPFLSQYVHGLSTSNIVMTDPEDDFQPIWTYAISLMGKLQTFMEKFYGLSIKDAGIPLHQFIALSPKGYLEKFLELTGG